MPSTWSSRFRLNLQAPGENLNTWGLKLNTGVFQLLEDAVAKRLNFALSGSKTLTTVNGEEDEARCAFLDVTSGTGGTITIPSVEKTYLVRNNSSGDVVVTTGAGVTATIPAGSIDWVVSDASNVRQLMISGLPLKTYIDAAILATTGSLPATTGNEGRGLFVTSGAWTPRFATTSDLSDLATYTTARRAEAIAFAVALSGS